MCYIVDLTKFKDSEKIINSFKLIKKELEVQHKRKEFIYVQKSSIEQGIKKGIHQKNIEIAKNLLDVLDNETIALKIGLEKLFI